MSEMAKRVVARFMGAMEHDSPEALKAYLKDHPDADKSKHADFDFPPGASNEARNIRKHDLFDAGLHPDDLKGYGTVNHVLQQAEQGKTVTPLQMSHAQKQLKEMEKDLGGSPRRTKFFKQLQDFMKDTQDAISKKTKKD
jgi:hypothetical protein